MKSIFIRNWDKWQSYRRDRNPPPWIKIHKILLNDPEWNCLSDAEKGQLVSFWVVGASKGGELPYDAKLLRKVCLLDDEPNIQRFLELGFLTTQKPEQDVNGETPMTPDGRHPDDIDDLPEESRVEENREEKKETDMPETSSDTSPLEDKQPNEVTEQFKVANHLADQILNRDSKYSHLVNGKRSKTVESWASDIEKLNRIDGRDWQDIWKVLKWCQEDDFWCRNILSGKKLRDQFSKLLLQMPIKPSPNIDESTPDYMQGVQ